MMVGELWGNSAGLWEYEYKGQKVRDYTASGSSALVNAIQLTHTER